MTKEPSNTFARMKKILVVTHVSSKSAPPQALLVQRMLAQEGYLTVVVGKGETGLTRTVDIAWRGLYQMFQSDVVLVDVFGGKAFLHEALAIIYGRLLGRRVVAMLRGGWLKDFIKARRRLACWVLRRSDLLLAPHAFLAEDLKDMGLDIQRCIPNVIDLGKYRYQERTSLEARFLYLRGAHSIYGPETSLRAFALIQAIHPQASLTFAGSDLLDSTKALAKQLALRNVSFIGQVPKEQIPGLADNHDIYLQSPRVENMPVTVLEMWASGLPVVSTNVGGISYLVQNEEDGLLVPTDDHQALADACCRLLSDPQLALKLLRNGRKRVEQFTWENVRSDWLEVLRLNPEGDLILSTHSRDTQE